MDKCIWYVSRQWGIHIEHAFVGGVGEITIHVVTGTGRDINVTGTFAHNIEAHLWVHVSLLALKLPHL